MTILVPSTESGEKPSEPSLAAKGLKKAVKNIAATVPRPPIKIARRSRLTRAERRLAVTKACSRSRGGAAPIRRVAARAERAAVESASATFAAIGSVSNADICSLFDRLASPRNPNSVAKLGPGRGVSQCHKTLWRANLVQTTPFGSTVVICFFVFECSLLLTQRRRRGDLSEVVGSVRGKIDRSEPSRPKQNQEKLA